MRDKRRKAVISVFGFGLLLILVNCNNPLPTLSSLTPDTKVYHMPSFTLTVNGTDFTSDTVIVFNNVQKPTTLISSSEMTCLVDTSDIATAPASLPVLAKDTVSGDESNTLYFTVEQVHTFPTPVQISLPIAICHNNNHTKIAVDEEKNVNIVWGECLPAAGMGFVYFVRSEDLGLTWINLQELPEKSYWGNFFPVIALDSSKNINIVYTKQTSGQEMYDLKFLRSLEGQGVHWTGPLNLSSGWALWSKYSDIGIGPYNNTEHIALVFNSFMMTTKINIYFIYSSDSGMTWSLPVDVSKTPGDSGKVSMAVDTDGKIYVVWLEYSTLTNYPYLRIFFNQSADFGVNWGNPMLLSPNSCARSWPDVEVGESGYVYALWVEQEGETYSVIFRSSNNAGNTWIAPVSLAQGMVGNLMHAYIAADKVGNVNLFYINDSGSFFRRSTDRGASWETPIQISLLPGHGDITLDNEGNIYLSISNRDGIFFTRSQQ